MKKEIIFLSVLFVLCLGVHQASAFIPIIIPMHTFSAPEPQILQCHDVDKNTTLCTSYVSPAQQKEDNVIMWSMVIMISVALIVSVFLIWRMF